MCWGTLVLIGLMILTIILVRVCGGSEKEAKKAADDAGKF